MDLLEGDHRGKNSALLRNLPVFSFERMSNEYRILFCKSFRADGPVPWQRRLLWHRQSVLYGIERVTPEYEGLRALLTMEIQILTY